MTYHEIHDELRDCTDTLSREGLGDADTNELFWAKKLAAMAKEYIEAYETEFGCVDSEEEPDDTDDIGANDYE